MAGGGENLMDQRYETLLDPISRSADTYENLLDPKIRKRFGEKIKVAGRIRREE